MLQYGYKLRFYQLSGPDKGESFPRGVFPGPGADDDPVPRGIPEGTVRV